MLAIGLGFNLAVSDFIVAVMAPILPALTWALKEARRQWEAFGTMTRLKGAATAIWDEILSQKLSDTRGELRSRQLQDAIFMHRARAPLVFDWIYNLLRNKYEKQMSSAAQQMLSEARAAGIST